MPELPDIELYLQALRQFVGGQQIEKVHVKSPFVVRTFEPDIHDCVGQKIVDFQRMGKRIVWELDNGLFIIFHLMIAGRFHWRNSTAIPKGKNDLVSFQIDGQSLVMTEASTKKRASIHVVTTRQEVEQFRPEGLEIDTISFEDFCHQLDSRNHTLKRCLTDPHLFSGIGNAYSDEILHAAKLSPVKWTSRLNRDEKLRLFEATIETLDTWQQRLCEQMGNKFPKQVTAFRPEMAVHGKYGSPCPVCQSPIQRIRYADRETNYCAACQTDGKILADRSLSRLLKDDWPRTLEELEGGD